MSSNVMEFFGSEVVGVREDGRRYARLMVTHADMQEALEKSQRLLGVDHSGLKPDAFERSVSADRGIVLRVTFPITRSLSIYADIFDGELEVLKFDKKMSKHPVTLHNDVVAELVGKQERYVIRAKREALLQGSKGKGKRQNAELAGAA